MPPVFGKQWAGIDAIDVSILNLIRRTFNKCFLFYFSLAFGKFFSVNIKRDVIRLIIRIFIVISLFILLFSFKLM